MTFSIGFQAWASMYNIDKFNADILIRDSGMALALRMIIVSNNMFSYASISRFSNSFSSFCTFLLSNIIKRWQVKKLQ